MFSQVPLTIPLQVPKHPSSQRNGSDYHDWDLYKDIHEKLEIKIILPAYLFLPVFPKTVKLCKEKKSASSSKWKISRTQLTPILLLQESQKVQETAFEVENHQTFSFIPVSFAL